MGVHTAAEMDESIDIEDGDAEMADGSRWDNYMSRMDSFLIRMNTAMT